MVYEIQEISTDKASGATFVLVWFWPSEAARLAGPESPHLVNDFLMTLRPTETRVVRDGQGRMKRTDGTFIEPAEVKPEDELERETVERPLPLEITANIEAYMNRATAKRYSGDHTGDASKPFFVDGVRQKQVEHRIERDNSDPRDVLKHAGVAALKELAETRKRDRAEANAGGPKK